MALNEDNDINVLLRTYSIRFRDISRYLYDISRLSCMPLCVWIEEISRRYLLEIDITHYTLIPYYDSRSIRTLWLLIKITILPYPPVGDIINIWIYRSIMVRSIDTN
jgi:hypothetical protein